MIDLADWQRLSALLDEALALDAEARQRWLRDLATREPALADRVARALAAATARAARDAAGTWLRPALNDGDADEPARPGATLGAWRLVEPLGRGGMGEVWRARRDDGLYEAEAAIKLLRSDLSAERLAGRFARERAVLARLNHPGIARMLDAGVHDGQAFIVLEQVKGVALDAWARTHAPLLAARLRLLLQVAEAVEHAHALLVVHRDLKPANVLVTPEGRTKLLDFGIAGLLDDDGPAGELTRMAGRALTPGYAAPEQIAGLPVAAAADVFALGVMLYELIDGSLPFAARGATRTALEHAVLHDEPRRLGSTAPDAEGPGRPSDARRARGDLEAIAAKALRKDPAARYASVRALIDELQRWLDHRPVQARRDDWRHRSRLFVRRHALLVAATASVTVALAAGGLAAARESLRAQAAAERSERVTLFLSDMLSSAKPAEGDNRLPTVQQLLDRSSADVERRFGDDPQTRLQVLDLLALSYKSLHRFDRAIPLGVQALAQNTQLWGPYDPRTVNSRIGLAQAYQTQGMLDKAIALAEPTVDALRQRFGPSSSPLRRTLYLLATCYARVGRTAEAERALDEGGRITDQMFEPGHFARLQHLNYLQVLRVHQGRLHDGLAALLKTQPSWPSAPPRYASEVLVLRRNIITVQVMAGIYDRVEPRTTELIADMDRVLGPGSDMATGMRGELARYFHDIGRADEVLRVRQENLEQALAAGVDAPAQLLPLQAYLLEARALARQGPPAARLGEARRLLDETQAQAGVIGIRRGAIYVALAKTALADDDAELAGDTIRVLQGDAGLAPAIAPELAMRVAQLEGQLARLQGRLDDSRRLLAHRLAGFDQDTEHAIAPAWLAALDLAYTLVLQRAPEAAAALADAARRRPPAVPPGHALDRLAARLAEAIAQPGRPPAGGRASQNGVLG